MHYFFAFVVTVSKNGARSEPRPYTVRATHEWEAHDKLVDELGEGKYEITIATSIGYDERQQP